MKVNTTIRGLKPDSKTEDAARLVLTSRLAVLGKTLAKANPELTVEYVHQLRVGSRRVGAALRVFKPLIPRKKWNGLKDHLRTLRRAAAETRDWDVFMKYLSDCPKTTSQTYMLGYSQGVRSRSETALGSALIEQSPAILESLSKLPESVSRSHSVPRTLGKFAYQQLGEQLARFQSALDAKPASTVELHQLRIQGKRLRYAIELFNGCLPAELMTAYLDALASVQTTLGTIQDCAVFTGHISEIQPRMGDSVNTQEVKALLRELVKRDRASRSVYRKWQMSWKKLLAKQPLIAVEE